MRVLFVLPRMVSGGVERVTLNLIAGFAQDGHECALALRKAHGELLAEARLLTTVYEVAPGGLHEFVPRLAGLIRKWRPTHVITAFSDVGVLTWAALRLAHSDARWVHGVHNTHAPVTARPNRWGAVRFWLDTRFASFVYHHAAIVVAVSNGVRDEIVDDFQIAPAKVVTIYNPVVPDAQLIRADAPRHSLDQPFTIVGLGRLTRQKGFDVLIDAMREVPGSWRLDIWGEGEERSALQRRIERYGLQASIHLRSYTNDPYAVLRAADLFVLSSRWEGLPTVVIEALACQCPIVATDCPHGPREILAGGEYGQLVPVDAPSKLANAIRREIDGVRRFAPNVLLARASDFSERVASLKWIESLGGD